jgi:hypothetical protein
MLLTLLTLILCSFSANSFAGPTPETFSEFFEQEWDSAKSRSKRSKPEITTDLKQWVDSHHFVFVGGVFGEMMPGNFRAAKKVLKREFHTDFSFIQPESCNTVLENAKILTETFYKINAEQGKPLIVIGHSKAGPEIILALLADSSLLDKGVISHVITIQGALGGSSLTDVLDPSKIPLIRKCDGLESLSPENIEAVFDSAWNQFQESTPEQSLENLNDSVFYIRSQIIADNPMNALIPFRKMLRRTHEGKNNDGLIPVELQYRPEFGTDLGILDADHADLVMGGILSNSSKTYRRTFIRTLITYLFASDLSSSD